MNIHDNLCRQARAGCLDLPLRRTVNWIFSKRTSHTLVGVLGQGALMSFLLGRWPRCKVTLDGTPDADWEEATRFEVMFSCHAQEDILSEKNTYEVWAVRIRGKKTKKENLLGYNGDNEEGERQAVLKFCNPFCTCGSALCLRIGNDDTTQGSPFSSYSFIDK